jgi:hypothetical protein
MVGAVIEESGRRFIQVGITALRNPTTGEFLPAVPLFIENTDGAAEAETAAMIDVCKVFAQRMKQYLDAGEHGKA